MKRPLILRSLFFVMTACAAVANESLAGPILDDPGVSVVGTVDSNSYLRTVTSADIERAQAPDLPTLLQRTLGLTVVSNGGYGNVSSVSLRGLGGGRVAVLIDGIAVNSMQSGEFDLSRVPVESLERIEVVAGGSDSHYSVDGAEGGVINLITVPVPSPGLVVSGGVSNRSYLVSPSGPSLGDSQGSWINLAGTAGPAFWSLGLAAHRASNRFGFTDDEGHWRDWTGNSVVDAGWSLSASMWSALGPRLVVTNSGYWGNKDIPGPLNSAAPGQEEDWNVRSSVAATWSSVGSDALSSDLVLSHVLTRLKWVDALSSHQHTLNTFGAVNRWDWQTTETLALQVAFDAQSSILKSSEVGERYDTGAGLALTVRQVWSSALEMAPSLKLVVATDLDVPVLVPKLGFVYSPHPQVKVKNNYFRTYKRPSLNDRYWPNDGTAQGNPALRPEDGWGTDFVVEGPLGGWFDGEATVFANAQTDAILWQPSGGHWSPQNVGRALFVGSESSLRAHFDPHLVTSIQYSALMSWALGDGLGFADNRRIPYRPVHALGFTIGGLWNAGSVLLTGHWESERYVSTLNVTKLPPFFTLDVALEHHLGDLWSLGLVAANVFNASYVTVDGYPMPGAALTARLSFHTDPKSAPSR